MSRTGAAVLLLVSCGGDGAQRCDDPDCDWAGLLAARYTAELAPTADEVQEALRIYKAGLTVLEPRPRRTPTPHAWNVDPLAFVIQTTDVRFTASWDREEVVTGVEPVNDVLAQCDVERIHADPPFYTFYSRWFVAAQNIDLALAVEPALSLDYFPLVPVESAFSDVRFVPGPDDTTDVTYAIGWGTAGRNATACTSGTCVWHAPAR